MRSSEFTRIRLRQPPSLTSALAASALAVHLLSTCAVAQTEELTPTEEMRRATIEKGIAWLLDHQDEEGRWDCDRFMKHDIGGKPCDGAGSPSHDVGITALALNALNGTGSTLRSGAYHDNIKMAVRWLRKQQNRRTGLFGTDAHDKHIYGHAIATLAMTEAYGLSDYKFLKKNAVMGVRFLASRHEPKLGWSYAAAGKDRDAFATAWCVLALLTAKRFKLDVDEKSLADSLTSINRLTDKTGRCGYSKPGGPSKRYRANIGYAAEQTEAMTAAGLFCRFMLGQDPKDTPIMGKSLALIVRNPPRWDGQNTDLCYWFFASNAMNQFGNAVYPTECKRIVKVLSAEQRTDGKFSGSFDPDCAWGAMGGRVYSTAMAVMILQSQTRYPRIAQANARARAEAEVDDKAKRK